jgi:hypothetical protein
MASGQKQTSHDDGKRKKDDDAQKDPKAPPALDEDGK